MSEPVLRRTQSGVCAALMHTPAFRFHSPLAKAISLCGVLSVLTFSAAPVLAADTAAATVYSIESAKAVESLLLDVAHAGARLVAVGDRGHILYSDDNGASWAQAKVPTRQMLTSVFFIDDKKGWVTGHDALILATEDGGMTWTEQFIDLEREAPLLDIWFKNAEQGFAVGAYGALLETTDGGANWSTVTGTSDTNALLLAADGKLSLDADARTWLPELPVYDRPITVRHLTSHTGGIRHYANQTEFLNTTAYYSVKESIRIFKDDSLLFKPGTILAGILDSTMSPNCSRSIWLR